MLDWLYFAAKASAMTFGTSTTVSPDGDYCKLAEDAAITKCYLSILGVLLEGSIIMSGEKVTTLTQGQ